MSYIIRDEPPLIKALLGIKGGYSPLLVRNITRIGEMVTAHYPQTFHIFCVHFVHFLQ